MVCNLLRSAGTMGIRRRVRPGQTGLVLLATLAFAQLSQRASGTTFVLMSEQQMLETSEVVVVGTVTAIESGEDAGTGAIQTYVHILPSGVIKGDIGDGPLVIREPGGSFGERREWVYGAPEFRVGERNLLFLSRNADGTLQTNSLSMGKFTLSVDSTGRSIAMRAFGYGASVVEPSTGAVRVAQAETQAFAPLLSRLHALTPPTGGAAPPRPLVLRPQELDITPTETHESFTLLGSPARWFEPDSGQAVAYYIDSTGDSKLGFDASRAAIDGALAAWTNVPTSSLILVDGGTTTPGPFGQCAISRIVFNDPNNEITNPSGCSGVLAMGGFCTNGESTVVNGTVFNRIVVGKVTFNDGWNNCSVWSQCNVAEVAAHEIGHTIGLGHSTDGAATMRASAHFDGRCAGLATDDMNAVTFVYPGTGDPEPTLPPDVPSPTFTATPLTAATVTPTPPPTPTDTRAPTRTFTPMPTATRTPTFTPLPIHDSVIAPLRPLNVTIASGRTSVTRKVRVRVTNADVGSFTQSPLHTIKLVASGGDCPAGTIVGLPDFNGYAPGDQDTVQLVGGTSRSAAVILNIDSAAFAGLQQQGPMRCTLTFTASVVQPVTSLDPTPANNVAVLELNVVDKNAGGSTAQPVLKSVAPLKITIARGQTSVTKKIIPRLGNDANGASLARTAALSLNSDCPESTINAANPNAVAAGSARAASDMSLLLTVSSAAFNTPHGKSPARCSVTLTASGTGIGQQDGSRESRLVIDVVDKNDF